jgi:hypothetical protein
MIKPVLAIARLVASCAPVFSQTAGTNSIAVLTLTDAKFDQPLFAKRSQKAQYIPKIGVQFLYTLPFTSRGLTQNVNSTEIPLKWDVNDWSYKRRAAASITLLLLPVLHWILVRGLKIVKCAPTDHQQPTGEILQLEVEASS